MWQFYDEQSSLCASELLALQDTSATRRHQIHRKLGGIALLPGPLGANEGGIGAQVSATDFPTVPMGSGGPAVVRASQVEKCVRAKKGGWRGFSLTSVVLDYLRLCTPTMFIAPGAHGATNVSSRKSIVAPAILSCRNIFGSWFDLHRRCSGGVDVLAASDEPEEWGKLLAFASPAWNFR